MTRRHPDGRFFLGSARSPSGRPVGAGPYMGTDPPIHRSRVGLWRSRQNSVGGLPSLLPAWTQEDRRADKDGGSNTSRRDESWRPAHQETGAESNRAGRKRLARGARHRLDPPRRPPNPRAGRGDGPNRSTPEHWAGRACDPDCPAEPRRESVRAFLSGRAAGGRAAGVHVRVGCGGWFLHGVLHRF